MVAMVGGENKKAKGRRGGKKGRSSAGINQDAAGAAGAVGGGGGPSFPVVSDSRFSSMHNAPVSVGLSGACRVEARRPPYLEEYIILGRLVIVGEPLSVWRMVVEIREIVSPAGSLQ